jgi:hypothetical protein
MTLDDFRAFLRSDDEFPNVVHRSRYSEFLISKGFGAMQFTHRQFSEPIVFEHNRAAFQPLCDFWREYLSVRDLSAPFPEFPYE